MSSYQRSLPNELKEHSAVVRGFWSAWLLPINSKNTLDNCNQLHVLEERHSFSFLGTEAAVFRHQGWQKWLSPSSPSRLAVLPTAEGDARSCMEADRPAASRALSHSASWLCALHFNPQVREQKQIMLGEGKPEGQEQSAFPALVLPWRGFFLKSEWCCYQTKKIK